MGATVFYLLRLQKYISSKKKILKKKKISCVQEIFQRISQPLTRKKAELSGYIYEFSVDYNIIGTSNIINIHKYFMKKNMM